MFGVGVILGVAMLPFALIYKQGEELDDWARLEGLMIGLSVPPILIGSMSKKHDMNDWAIRIKKSRNR